MQSIMKTMTEKGAIEYKTDTSYLHKLVFFFKLLLILDNLFQSVTYKGEENVKTIHLLTVRSINVIVLHKSCEYFTY